MPRHSPLHFALAALLLAGCAGKRLLPVEGTVVYEDGSPAVELAGGTVSLEAVEDRKNAAGQIQSDGTFRVRGPAGGDGVPPGAYRVLVQPAEGKKNTMIDPKYGRYATSGIEITVTDPPGKVEMKVQRAKGR